MKNLRALKKLKLNFNFHSLLNRELALKLKLLKPTKAFYRLNQMMVMSTYSDSSVLKLQPMVIMQRVTISSYAWPSGRKLAESIILRFNHLFSISISKNLKILAQKLEGLDWSLVSSFYNHFQFILLTSSIYNSTSVIVIMFVTISYLMCFYLNKNFFSS